MLFRSFKDNDSRTIFFCRGVLETVKKLGWSPDIVHCHGWMTSLIPMYIKTSYREDPCFKNSRIIYSAYNDEFDGAWAPDFNKRLLMEGVTNSDVKELKDPNYLTITQNAIRHSDAIIKGSDKLHTNVDAMIKKSGKPVLSFQTSETMVESCNQFYDEVMEEASELV